MQQSIGQVMGRDIRGVRVHTDRLADRMTRSLGARAFTTGRDVFFRRGEYNPQSEAGRRLLAHEITHVCQQKGESVLQRAIKKMTPKIAPPEFYNNSNKFDAPYYGFDSTVSIEYERETDKKKHRLVRCVKAQSTYAADGGSKKITRITAGTADPNKQNKEMFKDGQSGGAKWQSDGPSGQRVSSAQNASTVVKDRPGMSAVDPSCGYFQEPPVDIEWQFKLLGEDNKNNLSSSYCSTDHPKTPQVKYSVEVQARKVGKSPSRELFMTKKVWNNAVASIKYWPQWPNNGIEAAVRHTTKVAYIHYD